MRRNGPLQPDRSLVRKLLTQLLPTDSDLDSFVLDFFPAVYDRFSGGMDRTQKINTLLVCEPHCAHIVERLCERYPDHPVWSSVTVQTVGPPHASTRWFPLAVLSLVVACGVCLGLLYKMSEGFHPTKAAIPPIAVSPLDHGSASSELPASVGPNSNNSITDSPGASIHNEVTNAYPKTRILDAASVSDRIKKTRIVK